MASSTLSASIRSVWHRVHSPTSLPFPQTITELLTLKVSRYHIDYVASTATAYIPNPKTGGVDFDVAGIPPVRVSVSAAGRAWNERGVVDAIRWAQSAAPDYTYAAFEDKCVEAGVTDYMEYLEGKKVVYFGGKGDIHVEWFPGAEPMSKN